MCSICFQVHLNNGTARPQIPTQVDDGGGASGLLAVVGKLGLELRTCGVAVGCGRLLLFANFCRTNFYG